MLAQSSNQTDIFSKFYSPADTFWSPKTVEQVLGYTTGSMYRLITLDKFLTDQSTKTLRFQMFHMPIIQRQLLVLVTIFNKPWRRRRKSMIFTLRRLIFWENNFCRSKIWIFCMHLLLWLPNMYSCFLWREEIISKLLNLE